MRNLLTWILAGLSMTGALAIDMYLPSFHGIGASFAASPALVQQTLSAFLFAFAFMMLFSGTLSDSFGRRPLILGSLALYGAASFGAAVAPTLGWLLACRVLQGLAAGVSTVVGRAVIQDRLSGTDAQRMMASVMMVFGLAPAIAPILGGWLHTAFGWRSVFLFLGSFGALMLLVCWRSLPESLPAARRHAFHPGVIARAYWEVLRDRRFLLLALAFGLSFGGIALYIGSAASFVVGILHLPETGFGWMFIPLIGGMVCGSAAAGRLAARMPQARQIRVGYGVMGAAALVNVLYNALSAAALPWAVLPLFFYAGADASRHVAVSRSQRAGRVAAGIRADGGVCAGVGAARARAVRQRAEAGLRGPRRRCRQRAVLAAGRRQRRNGRNGGRSQSG
jgi:DHA1 family bicyclomycin/chloramphenicol resistance-like MFS transporter